MKIYLTRHGQTKANLENRFQGFSDAPLTEDGIKAAKDLRDFLKNKDIDMIACSSLPRAKNTALIIKANRNWPIYYYDELKEFNFGDLEGLIIPELAGSEIYENFFEHPQIFQAPKGENFKEFILRISNKIEDLYQEFFDKKILVVAHGLVVRTLILHYRNTPLEKLHQGKYPFSCSLSELDYQGKDKVTIISECTIDHLKNKTLVGN